MIIDTHAHLDDVRYNDDIEKVLENATNNGIDKIIIPGASLCTLKRAYELALKYDNIYYSVGVHPYDINEFDLEYLKQFINHKKCVAVGECGLDYYRKPSQDEKELQKKIFKIQIELSLEYNLPLILHVRDANQDVYDILKEYPNAFGVFHCYNASPILLDYSKNYYYGIGGVLTFKNAKELVSIVNKIPLERILIETDAPYLTPHPFRGERNEPAYCRYVVEKLSEILNISIKDIENLSTQNALDLFKGLN